MFQKRNLASLILLVILCGLGYLQFQQWRSFDWNRFLGASHVQLPHVGAAIGLIYVTGVLRALRWRLFLRQVRETTTYRLISPTFVGFTATALLGRPGEFVRPYLIAKKEKLSVSSQLGVWTVERILDLGAFSLLMSSGLLLFPQLRSYPYVNEFRAIAIALCGFVALAIFSAVIIGMHSTRVLNLLHVVSSKISAKFANQVDQKLRSFGEGVNAMSSGKTLLQLVTVSLTIWLVIALAFLQVVRSYRPSSETGPQSTVYVEGSSVKRSALPEFAGREFSGSVIEKVTACLGAEGDTVVKQGNVWAAQKRDHLKQIRDRPQLGDLDIPGVLLLMGFSAIGSLLQLPAVGGGNQLAVITALQIVYGFPAEVAVSCGILLWLVTTMSCVPVGLVFLRREHLSLRGLSESNDSAAA